MVNFIPFSYTIRNKVYLPDESSVMINLAEAKVIGWRVNRIWSDRIRGFIEETTFSIVQGESEYSTLVLADANVFLKSCDNIPGSKSYFEDDYIEDGYYQVIAGGRCSTPVSNTYYDEGYYKSDYI